MTATAAAFLNVARSQIGYVERPGNWTKYGAWFGMNPARWCDMFVSWCAAEAGGSALVARSAWVPGRWASARKAGRTSQTPRAGDLAVYDFNRDGVPDHIEIVEAVLGDGRITVIGGNTPAPAGSGDQADGDGVWRKTRKPVAVVGYIRPGWATGTTVRPAPTPPHVRTPPLVVDGVWGPRTTQRLQRVLHLTPTDGVCGVRTVRALQAWLRVKQTGVMTGPTQAALTTRVALQHRIGVQGDGVIGPITVKALQRYLNRVVS